MPLFGHKSDIPDIPESPAPVNIVDIVLNNYLSDQHLHYF